MMTEGAALGGRPQCIASDEASRQIEERAEVVGAVQLTLEAVRR